MRIKNGRIRRWKNRSRFYAQEKKANQCLPIIYSEVSKRIIRSLRVACKDLGNETRKMKGRDKYPVIDGAYLANLQNEVAQSIRRMMEIASSAS